MKNQMKKLLAILLVIVIGGCIHHHTPPQLAGVHKLRKLVSESKTYRESHGGFFLISGSYSSTEIKRTTVSFSYQLPDKTYAFETLPLRNIRVFVDTAITHPYVTFETTDYCVWDNESRCRNDLNRAARHILFAIIHCHPHHFPENINIEELSTIE